METLPALQGNQVDLLISQAIDKNVPVEALEKLLDMRTKWLLQVAEEEFNIAMTGFQSECPIIKKTKKVYGKNGFLYAFAPIDSIVSQIKGLIAKYKFSYSFDIIFENNIVYATCTVKHIRGHKESKTVPLLLVAKTAAMNDSQQVAATITMAKRYALENSFGISTGMTDTDGMVADSKVTEEQIDKIRELLSITGYKEESVYKRFNVIGLDMLTYEQAQQTLYALMKSREDVKENTNV